MTYEEAQILIQEAYKLGYRGSDWEQSFIAKLSLIQPRTLTPEQEHSVNEFYRRAAGGGHRERHQIINCKHRYNPGLET